jgi:hypothetical protein
VARHLPMALAAAVLGLSASVLSAPLAAEAQSACMPAAPSSVPFGLLGPNRNVVSLEKRINLYSSLGVRWLRITTTVPATQVRRIADIQDVPAYHAAGFDIFASLVNQQLPQGGFAQDRQAQGEYARNLRNLLQTYQPQMVAVENEVDNFPMSMSADDYLAEVNVTCSIAHQMGEQCTDSGMTSKMEIALLVDYNLSQGDVNAAERNARYLGDWYADKPGPGAGPDQLSAYLHSKGVDRARAILQGIKAAGADRVDTHWYIRPSAVSGEADKDQNLLPQVLAMLRARSGGLPVAGGEVGVDSPHMIDTDLTPQDLHGLVSNLASQGVAPIIVWNPGAGQFTANVHALSLVDAQGNPLPDARGFAAAARQSGAQQACQVRGG